MDAVLTGALQDATYAWLDRLEKVTAHADTPSLIALARTELARMVAAWRELLAQHQPDDSGRCTQCSGWRRRRAFPCSVWQTAHQRLVASEPASASVGRHAMWEGSPW